MSATKSYLAPTTLSELTRLAGEPGVTVLAGGTDLQPRWSKGTADRPEIVVDIKGINELKGATFANGEIRIGACTRINGIDVNVIVREHAPLLAEAAGRVACPQIRNRATLGGNLCNASPAADTAVPLIALDAVLDIATSAPNGTIIRQVPVTEFFTGPGATVLSPGDVLVAVRFKALPKETFSAWNKFGTRPSMEIAVASVGVVLRMADGKVTAARVGYGSVAPVPLRGVDAEAAIVNQTLSDDVIARCTEAARNEISPITDMRASERYRRDVVAVMLRRMLENARHARNN